MTCLGNLDLQPVAEPARAVGAVAVLGDDAFQAVLACSRQKCHAIRFDLLREADRSFAFADQVFQEMTTSGQLHLRQVMAIEIQQVECVKDRVV